MSHKTISIGGKDYPLVPTFEAIEAIEDAMGSTRLLFIKINREELGFWQCAQLVHHALKFSAPSGGPSIDDIADEMLATGQQRVILAMALFLASLWVGSKAMTPAEDQEPGEPATPPN